MPPDAMLQFQTSMRRWLPWIKRVAYCSSVTIEPTQSGEFFIKAVWPSTAGGPAGEHKVFFSRGKVLGAAGRGCCCGRVMKTTCHFKDDVVRSILSARRIR